MNLKKLISLEQNSYLKKKSSLFNRVWLSL